MSLFRNIESHSRRFFKICLFFTFPISLSKTDEPQKMEKTRQILSQQNVNSQIKFLRGRKIYIFIQQL